MLTKSLINLYSTLWYLNTETNGVKKNCDYLQQKISYKSRFLDIVEMKK
ncbi:Uncharacterised protein [Vibrio alginolyticus]|uniref:Uncharacterized protein n=1 Tax=Vibrio alginolyticus (strain ATCC 17749 / DSM 2171 / NBRC 15630 / NCIMB 1903 / NCTC 12160 / XII-53) TaxID=1219076 RepID=A0A2I3CKX1_VIBAX|nr:hypothetical protein N646_3447 [Vibrio alginolyticus NBRC 15630 = ATCC 17749]SQA41933.1 Uncharacterised protein [Vibrio alginolyticus]